MCIRDRLDRVRNVEIRQAMGIDLGIIETIEARRLNWFGHLKKCRMRDGQGRYENGLHPLEEKDVYKRQVHVQPHS